MTSELVPAALRERIAHDLRPVRPLRSPARRALALLPLGLALIICIPALWGLRSNLALLGSGAAWGLSAVQSLAGLLLVGVALREAVPGRELSAVAVVAIVGAAVVVFVGLTLITQSIAPHLAPPDVFLRYLWECFWMSSVTSFVPFAVAGWLAARALPTRPAVAGALYGLGAGLMNDAGVRLFCQVSSPVHVILAHGGAILFLVVAGMGTAVLVDRWKR
jgi:hypothetical protein